MTPRTPLPWHALHPQHSDCQVPLPLAEGCGKMAAAAAARSLAAAVVRKHTAVVSLPSLGQRLRLITPACSVYHMTPDELPAELGPEGEPFWGFVWPGSWGLSLHVRQNRQLVQGKRVLDFASGCGVSAIAAAQHGT